MQTKKPSWDDLRILLAVHRDKSFLAAGKTLGVAASTVARRVEAIERSLGRVLVHRGNDGTRLDPDALVELISEARVADLARGEADIGIRIVRSASAAIETGARQEPGAEARSESPRRAVWRAAARV